MKKFYSFVSGEYILDEDGGCSDIENPATGEIVGTLFHATPKIIDLAIKDSQNGMKIWNSFGAKKRGEILYKVANKIYDMNSKLAHLEVIDTGKPISEAESVDIISGVDCIKYFAGLADKIIGMYQNVEGGFYYTNYEPLGVCLGIGAWNYPFQIACWKAAPALAAGNSMIFKPSSLTSQTTLKLAEIIVDSGVPKGVFNVVLGDVGIGSTLVSHSDIAKVSLTGSVNTGRRVMSEAGKGLKHVTMELGGKSPLIVFEDADLDEAAAGAILGNFYTQGEICSNGTRVFVHEKIYNSFVEKVRNIVTKIKVGDPMHIQTHMGALISKQHFEKVLSYIEIGKKEGAKILFGGKKVHVDSCPEGHFIQPTIFIDCHDKMKIVQEEIFGPVMCILKFSKEEEVIQRANDTIFGLAAGIFTQNLKKAHKIVAQIQAGTCWINTYNLTPIEMPFGGFKASGIGRENGLEAIKYYTQSKSVYVALDTMQSPY